jgi:hypothetical protein
MSKTYTFESIYDHFDKKSNTNVKNLYRVSMWTSQIDDQDPYFFASQCPIVLVKEDWNPCDEDFTCEVWIKSEHIKSFLSYIDSIGYRSFEL